MRFAVILLLVSVAYGQQIKVFQFTHEQSPSDLDEFATVLRGIVGIQQLSVDNAARTLTVNAPDRMIRMASWLVQHLDVRADAEQPSLPGEYTSSAGDIVFPFMAVARTSDELQKIAAAVRTMAEMQQVFVCESLKAAVLRTTTIQQTFAAPWVNGSTRLASRRTHIPASRTRSL